MSIHPEITKKWPVTTVIYRQCSEPGGPRRFDEMLAEKCAGTTIYVGRIETEGDGDESSREV
jgi:hypothetical protein